MLSSFAFHTVQSIAKARNRILINSIVFAPRAWRPAIHFEVRIIAVARLVRFGEFGAFRFGQVSTLNPPADQPSKAVMQKRTVVTSEGGRLAHGGAANDLLDQIARVVDVNV